MMRRGMLRVFPMASISVRSRGILVAVAVGIDVR